MILTVDIEKCIGCNICEIACSIHHDKIVSPLRSRIEIINLGGGADVPIYCYQCDEASCAAVCPVESIKKDPRGAMVIDEETCIHCKACAFACPFGSMAVSHEGRVFKCDLCEFDPACVKVCPTFAITYESQEKVSYKKRSKAAEKMIASSATNW